MAGKMSALGFLILRMNNIIASISISMMLKEIF